MKRLFIFTSGALIAILADVQSAWACATCFGAEGDPQTEGMNMAIFTLIGVTYTLLGVMGATVFFIIRKARKNLDQLSDEELDDSLPTEDMQTDTLHG